MATLTLRPTSGTGSNWSNIANAYDNNKSTNASVSASRFNYSNKSATFTFDFSSIPEGSTINKVRVYLRYNVGKTTVAVWVYLAGNDQVSFVPSSTSILEEYNEVDGNSYTLDQLSSLKITPYNSNFTNNTLNVYEFWLEIDYTEPGIVADPPVITIVSQDVTKISGVSGHDRCTVTFTSDQALSYWEARATTTQTPAHGVGLLVESGTLSKGETGYVYVDDEELTNGDLNYTITIYGQNADGRWSDE